ncbi:ATP-dependent DNA ligase [Pseudoclavibacter sp. AY1F1]|uniref:ATP-dependent DNA ligase n=1 Tax=Pseudoclavibacter sp. AY1F1 TaxID=2080583 RepID=UPI000CE93532|nr:ATP-dependent DNA ligase [Pseudoclavibacter sp. AY1F1]PPF47299.1 ATP-dependent DNA ligase [Pseudoclavibacter sp. AY1F1]
MATSKQTVTVDGHRVTLTNLDKVLYPETGTTKADVLAYYAEIAPFLIPHVQRRPVTRKRWVDGVGTTEHPGTFFFQKNLEASAPDWVPREGLEHRDHRNEYPLVQDVATLTWLAQVAALELHVPQWRFGPDGVPRNPDRLVLDLDPGDGIGLAECAEVARIARGILRGMGLDPLPVTSGSKGIHLYAALDGTHTSDQVSQVAHELARSLEADHPDLIVSDMKKSKRDGKVLVDWSQNNAAKTTIAPYSLRGRGRPTVAVPRTWRELASAKLRHLECSEVLTRMRTRPDPLAAIADAAREDRLVRYRSMRDATKTTEPVPAEAPSSSSGRAFVIQEHHARRLHYDFRLEHDGVLVSWAVPKGIPVDSKKNHLAVQTEDHPLEYGAFEGTIPEGEYGAGEVFIWDFGSYELEKWREGEEVIVTLHGQPAGGLGRTTRVALIRTRGSGDTKSNWLLHRMELGISPAKGSRPTRGGTGRTEQRRVPVAPMLASARVVSDFDDEDAWAFEMKWDGIRIVASIDQHGVRLVTRNGNDVTTAYPEVEDALRASLHGRAAVLDGEIVALDRSARPDFGRLQARMGLRSSRDIERGVREVPVHYFVFDLLELDGTSMLARPYAQRRALLLESVSEHSSLRVPPAIDGDAELALKTSADLQLEGIVAKRIDSAYRPGRRTESWVKIKHHRAQEVVVGGWRPGRGRRSGSIGSLLLGIPEAGGLRYVGRVGTGFSSGDLERAAAKLEPLIRPSSPFLEVAAADARGAVWVEPLLVGEVEFAEWTASSRLRQPSWRGWRPDKSPQEVAIEGA